MRSRPLTSRSSTGIARCMTRRRARSPRSWADPRRRRLRRAVLAGTGADRTACPGMGRGAARSRSRAADDHAGAHRRGRGGQGFAVDRVAKIIAGHTATFIVDGSGDLVVSVRDLPLRVGLSTGQSGDGDRRRRTHRWCHLCVVSRPPILERLAPRDRRPYVGTCTRCGGHLGRRGVDDDRRRFGDRPVLHPARELRARLGIDFDYVTMYADGTAEWSAWPGLEMFS